MGDVEAEWTAQRDLLDRLAEHVGEWQGIPVPLPDLPVTLHDRHPLRDFFREHDGVELQLIVGGPEEVDDEERLVNSWFSRAANANVYVFERGDGTRFAVREPRSPDQSMDRLDFWLTTLGASDAWELDAEHRARDKLRRLLSERQWRHYDLTGSFLETSPRSRLTYLFRRLRPTVVLSPRNRRPEHDHMRCLAVLCLHPIGYYQRTWGGCLTPSDDVVSHLLFMRGDEAGFWKAANQHEAWRPEAGL